MQPRVGSLYLVRFTGGHWTAGRFTDDGIVVVGDANEWPRSFVEELGPEIDVLPHPTELEPSADMLADGWRPVDGATYQARAGEQEVAALVGVVFRLAYMMGFHSGRDVGFGQGYAEAKPETKARGLAVFEGEFGDGKVAP